MTNSAESEKNTLFDYLSNGFSSHANILIGFAVLLFTFFTFVATTGYFPRVRISSLQLSNILTKATLDYTVIFLVLLFLTLGTIFTLFRLIFYGAFCSVLVDVADTAGSIMELRGKANVELNKKNLKILGILPLTYWSTGLSFRQRGFWVSMIVAVALSTLLFVVFFLE